MYKIIREYFENKFETKGTNSYQQFIYQEPLGSHNIHDENPRKKLSVVVYLEPKNKIFRLKSSKNLEKVTDIFFQNRRKMIKKPLK